MIATYGDNCIDRYLRPPLGDFVGGNAVNVAAHLARLGMEVKYLGAVGDDREGELIREALSGQGIDLSHLKVIAGPSAVTLIELRDGERTVLNDDVGIQCPLILSDESLKALGRCSWVHCTAYTSWNVSWRKACPQITEEVAAISRSGAQVSLDFSELQKPKLATLLGRFLALAFVSRGERCSSRELDETFDFFCGCGIPEVVVTLGAAGAVYSSPNDRSHVPALQAHVVDTLGAGDAFIAAWLFARSEGQDVQSCAERATALASEVCSYFGAWPNSKPHRPTSLYNSSPRS